MMNSKQLENAIRHEGGLSRRLFLAYGSALAAVPFAVQQSAGVVLKKVPFIANPFSLGVASGDPDHQSVVLWTRLAPKPFEAGGGMGQDKVAVTWEIAEDDAMKNVVQKGTVEAGVELAHSVHVEVNQLKPDRHYWYRFRAGDAASPVGRTRTMPEPTAQPGKLRFAIANCQHFETGYYTAYDYMAKQELDVVFHLGDYIYEYAGQENRIRKHIGPKITTLDDYRIRHAQYKSDEMLQAAHARFPFVVSWDDHEFENNYANDISEKKGVSPGAFLIQRAASYKAYYESMPLRAGSIPAGPDMHMYRTISFGKLAAFQVLDTRQYRSDQPNGDRMSDLNDAALDAKQTMLGKRQSEWLKNKLTANPATWNVLAQQVMMGMVDFFPGEVKRYSMDQWPGYAHERMDLVQFLAEKKVNNPVVLTGDIHSNWVNNLRVDDRKHETPVVATEFVATSLSSGGKGIRELKGLDTLMAENPCVQFHNRERGYVQFEVTPSDLKSDYIVAEDVTVKNGPVVTRASFRIEAGKPGAKKV
jgi:alkaline phosphatase D